MTPERVLAALESGPMLSMAAGRTGAERRAIAEFVTGKSLRAGAEHDAVAAGDVHGATGDVRNPLAGPRWNGWGVNTQQHALPGRRDGRAHRRRRAAR